LVVVNALTVYPIKGLRGVSLSDAQLDRNGLLLDRQWMLVDAAGKKFNQKESGQLARCQVSMGTDALTVFTPHTVPLTIGLTETTDESVVAQIYSNKVEAVAVSEAADAWFSALLNREVRLLRASPHTERPFCTAFADAYPLLVCNQASLDYLNAHLPEPVPMDRFRANIVINGLPAFEENNLASLRIGDAVINIASPCVRCQVITIDQSSGRLTGDEPTTTLARLRGSPVCFGMNAQVSQLGGISVGDPVAVTHNF
jgi:uncharacterized protein